MAHKNAQWRYLDKFSHHSSSKTATLLPSHTIICQGVIVYNFYSYSNPIPPSLSPRWPRWHSLTSPEFQNLGGWSLHEKWCLILDVRFSSLSVTKVDVRRTFFPLPIPQEMSGIHSLVRKLRAEKSWIVHEVGAKPKWMEKKMQRDSFINFERFLSSCHW